MRLKKVKGAEEAVQSSEYVIHTPQEQKGRWKEFFGNENPLHIEVGMGKGQFITRLAQEHPEINYMGVEKYSSVLIKGVKKQDELKLPNLRFLCMDAKLIQEVFAPAEVDRLYLNFSDPWPKDRHSKRRLTSPEFLKLWLGILNPEGQLEFKTDNQGLFEFSVVSVEESGWTLTAVTRDLHHDPVLSLGNIMTEYEEKFSGRGNPICKLIALPPKQA